jgi:Fe-S-cluster containining protein
MGEAKFSAAENARALNDPAYQQALFLEAYEQTCLQLKDGGTGNDIPALNGINKDRNETIGQVAAAFASENSAECGSGCSFCCHQMVLCTPFEIFDIARQLLATRSTIEIADIKGRLAVRAQLPLDEQSRRGADKPCVLLEDHRCSVYEHRPSLCRTMLSTSRAACEASLASDEQTVPFIPEPVVISFLMQLGIDYALIEQRHLSTEKVEMSRALLIALENYEAAFAIWMGGEDAFPNCHPERGSGPSNHDLTQMAAVQSGLA